MVSDFSIAWSFFTNCLFTEIIFSHKWSQGKHENLKKAKREKKPNVCVLRNTNEEEQWIMDHKAIRKT